MVAWNAPGAGGHHQRGGWTPAMEPKPYSTDLTDDQMGRVGEPHLRRPVGPGRPATLDPRQVVDALLYQAQTGCHGPRWSEIC